MSGYGLSEEHQALSASVRRFATEVIAPQIGDLYVKEEFPYEIVGQLGEMGIFGLPSARSGAARAATTSPSACDRGDRPGGLLGGRHPGGGRRARRDAVAAAWHRCTEEAVAP